MAGGKLHGLPRFLMSYEISVLHPIGEWFGSRPNLNSLRIIGENPQLLGVCFLREVFETAIGSDQPACRSLPDRRLVRRSLGVGGSLGEGGSEVWCDSAVKNETPTADSRIKGVQSIERRYDLSSLPLDVGQFAGAVRDHWGVENSCHWVLDVVMREDQSRARIGFPAENLATVRRMAINLLNREKTKKRGIKGKQLNASWDHNYLLRLLNF